MKRLLVVCLSLLLAHEALAWGQKGHDVTAYVAENHLTKRAAKRIAAVLEGYSPVYVSNWLDNASHTPEYAYTKTWHYLNVDEGETLESMPKNPDGDVLKAVTEIVARLKCRASERPGREPRVGYLFRRCDEPPFGVGHGACGVRPPLELCGVAA